MWRRLAWASATVAVLLAGTAVFLSEFAAPREELLAKYGGPPSRFLTLPSGGVAHLRDRGDRNAPAVLLLPALNDSLHQWERWAQTLSDEYRIITIDLPGQGLTVAAKDEDYSYERMVTFIDEVVAELGLRRFAIGGNSFGGLIAVHYAMLRPDAISHLVLVSAAGIKTPGSRPPREMVFAQTPVVRELLRLAPLRLVFEGYLKEMIIDDRFVTEELIHRYWDLNRGRATVQMRRVTIVGERTDSEDQFLRTGLSSIRAPALVLGGREDRGTPPASAEFFASAIPSARLIVYEGVGHFAMIEAAERTAADVRSFLANSAL